MGVRAKEMVQARESGASFKEIAAQFGCSESSVRASVAVERKKASRLKELAEAGVPTEVSTRALNALIRELNFVPTAERIAACTRKQIWRLPNINEIGLAQIEEALRSRGLTFAG